MKVVFAERARQDISDIYDLIAEQSVSAAQRVEDAIRHQCERLVDFPFASAATDEPHVRRMPLVHVPYTIFYRIPPRADVVEIVRIVHSSRVQNLQRMP